MTSWFTIPGWLMTPELGPYQSLPVCSDQSKDGSDEDVLVPSDPLTRYSLANTSQHVNHIFFSQCIFGQFHRQVSSNCWFLWDRDLWTRKVSSPKSILPGNLPPTPNYCIGIWRNNGVSQAPFLTAPMLELFTFKDIFTFCWQEINFMDSWVIQGLGHKSNLMWWIMPGPTLHTDQSSKDNSSSEGTRHHHVDQEGIWPSSQQSEGLGPSSQWLEGIGHHIVIRGIGPSIQWLEGIGHNHGDQRALYNHHSN